ncbi:hypothetical protein BDN71DRAFT_1592081 [Pleurotus eryngii]|uniref:Uncharacterized protein n=1 Tax=Pleurotus eryngii TaxID=5323 RepID=A0A9P5ZPZ5_PLEER|nr:hypothetical protein BDN71DRAFT_1592081 [Pleurotus eryngii]
MCGPAIHAAAVATKALAKVFRSGGDGGEPDPGNGNTAFENGSDREGFNATERHEELMDEIVFPGIPPLLRDIVVHLRASGITQHLRHSELCPRYTGRDDPEGRMPNILYVLAQMQNEYAAVPIFDSLLFRGLANYVNPLTAGPRAFHIITRKVVFKSGVYSTHPAMFIMPIVVKKSDLLAPQKVNDKYPDVHLRLTGWVFDEVFELFSTFMGTLLNQDTVYAYMTSSALQFSSKSLNPDDPASQFGNQNLPQHSSAFGQPSPRGKQRKAESFLKFPHALGADETIPIYDGRRRHGNFRFEEQQWRDISTLPRYGVPPPPRGQQPDYTRAEELPPFEVDKFCVALIAFTIGTFNPKDNPTLVQISLNLHFAILLGFFNNTLPPRSVSLQSLSSLRATAAAQARAAAAAAAAQAQALGASS